MTRFLLLLIPLLVPACQSVSLADQAQLSKPAMSFESQGADLADFNLVSLIERGRASDSLGAGGGCSSCH